MCVMYVYFICSCFWSLVLYFLPDSRPLMWELFDDMLYGSTTCAITTIFYYACFYNSFNFFPWWTNRNFINMKTYKEEHKSDPCSSDYGIFLFSLWSLTILIHPSSMLLSLSKLYHLIGMFSPVLLSHLTSPYLLSGISLSVPTPHHLWEGPYLFFTNRMKLSIFCVTLSCKRPVRSPM